MSQELLKIVHGFKWAFNGLLIFIDCDYIHDQLSSVRWYYSLPLNEHNNKARSKSLSLDFKVVRCRLTTEAGTRSSKWILRIFRNLTPLSFSGGVSQKAFVFLSILNSIKGPCGPSIYITATHSFRSSGRFWSKANERCSRSRSGT